jgi:hypothetical protein
VARLAVPTPADRAEVARVALVAIAGGGGLVGAEPLLKRFGGFVFPFPGDVLIELAADALDVSGATRSNPVSLTDVTEQYLRDQSLGGNTARQKTRAAIELAVGVRAGIEPDYDAVAGWWRVNDFAFHAFGACFVMVRVAAQRRDTPVEVVCDTLAARRGLQM